MNHAPRMHPDDLRALMAAAIASDPILGERKDWADLAITFADSLRKKLDKLKPLASEPPASAPIVDKATHEQEIARKERERIIRLLAMSDTSVAAVTWDSVDGPGHTSLDSDELRAHLEPRS